MRELFADTFYWAALLNPRDAYHSQVAAVARSLAGVHVFTTEEVLTEFLTFFSAYGPATRQEAVAFVERLLAAPDVEVVPQDHEGFLAGLALYKQRLDKEYSGVDCISMTAMTARGAREALTHDHHFEQEGFTILL